MKPPTASHDRQVNTDFPVAHIEAQDPEVIPALREYLERNGTAVVVNRHAAPDPLYVLCIGTSDFVKSFFADYPFHGARKIGIVYEGSVDDTVVPHSNPIKYFLTDPVPITETVAIEIFSFFFTSGDRIKSNRKGHTTSHVPSVIKHTPQREAPPAGDIQRDEDTMRIADTMKQIFQPVKSKRRRGDGSNTVMIRTRWIFFILFIIFMPMALYVFSMVSGVVLLYAGGRAMDSGRFPLAKTLVTYGETNIRSAKSLIQVSAPVIGALHGEDFIEDQDRLLNIFSDISRAETEVMSVLATSKTVAGAIFFPADSQQSAGISDVLALTTQVQRVSQLLGLISAETNSLLRAARFPFTKKFVLSGTTAWLAELGRLREMIGYTEKLLVMYPRMAGFRKKQTYLVLLQNSMELRPTGGFIGSLLLLSFLDGKVDSMDVQDVYTADGQLKGHVEPPRPIREILGQEHWYLRDSNWDPDFVTAGKQAAWFYEKELGVTTDGVIAISLPMVTKMLEITGPIDIPDFNDRISAGNFYAKSLLYTQTDFFPGSTQKKDFLGALIASILTRITTDKAISSEALLQNITKSILSKDIQFYFTDPELQSAVRQWGWTGTAEISDCQSPTEMVGCIGDGIGLVSANLGVNKINFFIRQEALSDISILPDGSIDHTLTLHVENTAPVQSDGGNTYQSYMRFLIPKGTELRGITMEGRPVPARDVKTSVPPPSPYYIYEDGVHMGLIHVSVIVQPHETRTLVLHLVRPWVLANSADTMYQFRIRKQPGVEMFPWRTTVRYPENWSADSDLVANAGQLEYNTTLTEDGIFRILFHR